MNGTAKQIEWATKIRAEYIRDVRKRQELYVKAAEKAGQLAEWNAAMDDVVAQAEAKQSAAWWIDNRQHTGVSGGQIFHDMYTAAMTKVSAE